MVMRAVRTLGRLHIGGEQLRGPRLACQRCGKAVEGLVELLDLLLTLGLVRLGGTRCSRIRCRTLPLALRASASSCTGMVPFS